MRDFLDTYEMTDNDVRAANDRIAVAKAREKFNARTAHIAAAKDWPTPEALPSSLRPVEAFDMDLLPASLQTWARDIANRVQCPPDFIGATVIGALGVAIGRRVGVRPKLRDDWTEYANQWVCIVGRPGVMKSPAMSAVLAPLKRLDAEAVKRFEDEIALHESEAKVHKMRQDAAEKKAMAALKKDPEAAVDLCESEPPEPPKLLRYLVNDATVEKLGEICADNPQGVGVFRDELVSLLKGLDRDGQESARGFYLTGWNGNDGYIVDRIMRGHQRIEAVCLSVIGSTQPGRLSEYLRSAIGGGVADDGLVQRFGLMVWPDVPREAWENVDCWPDAEAKHEAFAVFKRLSEADPVDAWQAETPTGPDGQPDGNPPFLRLDAEALEVFVEWRTEHENLLRAGDLHPAMESHLAKYRKLVPSLALVLHLANGGAGPISARAMHQALAWSIYLRSHAERAYGSVLLAEMSGAKALLRRIQRGDLSDGFSARDVYRNQWSELENREATSKALAALVEYGYVRSEAEDTGGRSKLIYRIHPEARQ
ncbi:MULTISPECIES: YfjI family protein [unclassified Caballeronia]|uniref:YfjI family protein n=1 Tax=unclassified Caballeronia TaxID=2646786 RepID=UPI00285E9746|nr:MULTISPECIES: YfjI family protein [unclassified Caballeronia]MDR5770867.1 YfjI family protein [Caballeronia sp. LZ002]MDR5846304.1 YfjI family protein [Caballeronia sp. LZ003]